MKIGYFTERPYRWLPEDVILKNHAFFAVSNSHFDREKAADDYRYYLDENCYAEELGFDIVALNEHHGNPFCMGSVMNVEASVLAYRTKRVKIVLIGNPLPVIKHPLRMAEELAEIDLISRGRLVTGWVRGAGSEQFFNNANPAYNREYFNEAHDFIVQAWTKPGPWRYEGKHFHYRHVNPWALPYQKPHPPMWIPGVISPETVKWCAEHRYPYIGLGTMLAPTCDLWDYYADEAAKRGYQAGPENFGYLIPTVVAETEEKAHAVAENFVYGGGQNAFSAPEFTMPPGYNSKSAIRALAKQPTGSWLGVSGEKLAEHARESAAPQATRGSRQGYAQLPGYRRNTRQRDAQNQGYPAYPAARGLYHVQRAGSGEQRGTANQHAALRPRSDAGAARLRQRNRSAGPIRTHSRVRGVNQRRQAPGGGRPNSPGRIGPALNRTTIARKKRAPALPGSCGRPSCLQISADDTAGARGQSCARG
jgi:alkanesulfonate monooxygenase SsuD/methylene tetrahydromethanopterin reductase-like flavin-dependent oxidoreductase (luciferase family)